MDLLVLVKVVREVIFIYLFILLLLFFFKALLFFFLIYLFFIFGCTGSLLLHLGFSLVEASRDYSLLRCTGFSLPWPPLLRSAGSRAQAQQLWRTDLVVPWHVGSSQARARSCVPCIGRLILNHCATREAPIFINKARNRRLRGLVLRIPLDIFAKMSFALWSCLWHLPLLLSNNTHHQSTKLTTTHILMQNKPSLSNSSLQT